MNPEEQNIVGQAILMAIIFLGPALWLIWIDRREPQDPYDQIHKACHPVHKRWRDW